jgi:hypothetical protein
MWSRPATATGGSPWPDVAEHGIARSGYSGAPDSRQKNQEYFPGEKNRNTNLKFSYFSYSETQ